MIWRAKTSGVSTDLHGILPAEGGGFYTLGARGSFSAWNGETRTSYALGGSRNYLDLFGAEEEPLWIVGDETKRLDEGAFEDVEPGTERSLYGGFALDASLAWAVGTSGTIVRWDGMSFSPMDS